MPKRFHETYDREPIDDETREDIEAYLDIIEKKRHELVRDIRSGKANGTVASMYYSWVRSVIEKLGGGPYDSNPMEALSPELRAQVMQRALTQLSQLVQKVLPPQEEGGGGGGGSSQQQPQDGKPQPQKPEKQKPQPVPKLGNEPAKPTKEQPKEKSKEQPKPAPAAPVTPAPPQPSSPSKSEAPTDAAPSSGFNEDEGISHELDDVDEWDGEDEEEGGHGGGGEQHLVKADNQGVFYAIRDLLTKIAIDADWSERLPDGDDAWDAGRVVKSSFNPNYLKHAKTEYGVVTEDVYLTLDTSGSVDAMAGDIASMAAGAAGLVHLYHGTEARPHFYVPRKEPLKFPGQPFPEWEREATQSLWYLKKHDEQDDKNHYSRDRENVDPRAVAFYQRFAETYNPTFPQITSHSVSPWGGYYAWSGGSFEADVAWMLEREQVSKGSWLLFWGDTESVRFIAPRLLRRLVREYRFAWLYPYSRRWAANEAHTTLESIDRDGTYYAKMAEGGSMDGSYSNTAEVFKLEAVGLPVIYDVKGAAGVRRAFQRIQTIK